MIIAGWILGSLALCVLARWLGRSLLHWAALVQEERAREFFRLQSTRLHDEFAATAARSGKPRGLIWETCEFDEGWLLTRERGSGRLLALVAVTVHFSAIPGGDMEDVPAVPLPRQGTAVFWFDRGAWQTAGQILFNLSPNEAIDRMGEQLEKVSISPSSTR